MHCYSYSLEMVWYLSSLVYMDVANKQFRKVELDFEKDYNKLWIPKEKEECEKTFKKVAFECYCNYFISCLSNLKHYYAIEYETEKRDNCWYIYNIFGENSSFFVNGSACLMYSYGSGEVQRALRKIFIELYGCNTGEWVKDYDLANVDMNLWHYIYNTKLIIKERDYPKNKYFIR